MTGNRRSARHSWFLGGGVCFVLASLLLMWSFTATAQETTPQPPVPAPPIQAEPTATPLIQVTPGPTLAPEPIPDTRVWVTTQDRSSLRSGRGTGFDRLAIVPPETTIPAIGRSSDTRWVQVVYEGRPGWIAAWLLVWSGDFANNLPVDGRALEPFARRYNVLAETTRETPLYLGGINTDRFAGTIPAGTQVELTGRLGAGQFIQLQIAYNGQLYWVGSWNIRVLSGSYDRLFNLAVITAYGRLVTTLRRDIGDSTARLETIGGLWAALDAGQSVTCDAVPEVIDRRRVADSDVRREPVFAPLVAALDEAIARTNTAITQLEDACSRAARGEFFLTAADVRAALDEVNGARRAYVLAEALLSSLAARDPFANPGQPGGE